ncbi:MAG: aspartate aminotransferase family protein [Deltaproteobacteria bacterium CG11_big_fil_rev_8_21_14_0_20_47_16]|nr:MAG: aspartate aminotransferase family protein [Deltaproteobacteria bacterium CG11_big_fil_rev_8_21_14_0_20_47_16]
MTEATQQHDLYATHVNPQFVKVLRTIGYDKEYVRAEGQYLWDKDGNRYLDLLSGYGVFTIGRNHPAIKKALHDAIDANHASMVQMDAPLLAAQLAKRLLAKMPDHVDTVFFTNSGTEANEAAIKFAKCATKRNRIIYLDHAFHGLTNGSLSLNGNDEFRNGFEPLLPNCDMIPLNDIDALEAALSKKDVAAFVFEPIQGKGVYLAKTDYFQKAQALCRKYGTLMIADEVQSGLGRTGRWFAYEHYGISPDIITVAKALSGGFIPVGACCYPRAVYDKVFHKMDRCVVHSNTFGRNALAMVAGLATLDVMETENIPMQAAMRGEELIGGMRAMMGEFEMLSDVRGKGMMIAIEFSRPKSLLLRTGWDLIHKANKGLFGQMVVVPLMSKHRILSQVTGHNVDVVKLLPPAIMTSDDVNYFLDSFRAVMQDCHRFPGGAWEVAMQLAKQAIKA